MDTMNEKIIREKLVQAICKPMDNTKKIAIYGAGDTTLKYSPCFNVSGGEIEPQYFIDDTPSKSGTVFMDKPVINFMEAHTLCKQYTILVCSALPKTREAIIKKINSDPIAGTEVYGFDEYMFYRHANDILSVYDMLEDVLSKATYANVILTRAMKNPLDKELVQPNQYFCIPEFRENPYYEVHEVFVDCGAYVGDSIEQFISTKLGNFEKIFAFEPIGKTFQAMKHRIERLKREWALSDDQIVLVQAGVGSETVMVANQNASEQVGSCQSLVGRETTTANDGIPVYTIDNYFANQPISFLKADIENFEYPMLLGSETVIKRDNPKLAICIYHNPSDLYRIALKIKEYCPNYKFKVRHHSYTLVTEETVLYAYV